MSDDRLENLEKSREAARRLWRREAKARRQRWWDSPRASEDCARIQVHLRAVVDQLEPDCLGIYWPLPGEVPLSVLLSLGALNWALPYAQRENGRMHFRSWTPPQAGPVDGCGIVSSSGPPVQPDVLIVPCLGFNDTGHRLGYGGGYYDRYLAQNPGVTALGVAWSGLHVPSAQWTPQAHDVALAAVVTERGVWTG